MNIEIADRLQKLRKENGYSQEELADKLGISRQAVSKWERAESSPDTDNLIVLARLYNVSLDELLYDTETNEEIKDRVIDRGQSQKEADSIVLTDDEGQTLKIKDGHMHAYDNDGNEVKFNKKQTVILSAIDGVIALLTLIGFIIWGALFDGWYISWTLWVLMPAVMSIAECIMKKQLSKFVYPCLVAFIFLFIGMKYGLWHPYWVLFISIPVYYLITDPIDKYVLKTKSEDEDKE